MLTNNQLNHYFDFILDSAQMMYKKPGKEIYWKAIQRAGILDKDLHEVLFVGDNLRNDVLTPLEMGMQAWYFDRSDVRPGAAPPPGIRSFKNWSEFSGMIREIV
jgi:FMN phosphatase YigB (HAD superfamily)